MINPSNFATGPTIAPSYAVKIISDNVTFLLILNYGTGSYPPFEKGLHLNIRHNANALPFKAPYFSTASNPYSEQVGIYGHFVDFKGDKYFL